MGFRFSKRFSILPGVRLNVSGSGLGLSVGPRGASVSINRNGVYGNASLPGTGLSYRTKLSGSGAVNRSGRTSSGPVGDVRVLLQDDGTLQLVDSEGNELQAKFAREFKAQNEQAIQNLLEEAAVRMNEDLDSCRHIHHRTTAVGTPTPLPAAFDASYKPRPPAVMKPSLLDRMLGKVPSIDAHNQERALAFNNALAEWQAEFEAYEQNRHAIAVALGSVALGHVRSMEILAEYTLNRIVWPRETNIEFGISECGRVAGVNLDLPDEGDVPGSEAFVSRGKLITKPRSEAQQRKDFVNLAYGSVFRVAGELLAALPTISSVVISSYIQRPCTKTGQQKDEFVMSAIIDRPTWHLIDFSQIHVIDPCAALGMFKLRVKTDRSSRLGEIIPFEMQDAVF